jgi:hypothetical protein
MSELEFDVLMTVARKTLLHMWEEEERTISRIMRELKGRY